MEGIIKIEIPDIVGLQETFAESILHCPPEGPCIEPGPTGL